MFDSVLQQLAAIAVLVERGVQFVKTVIKYNRWAANYQQITNAARFCTAWSNKSTAQLVTSTHPFDLAPRKVYRLWMELVPVP